MQKDSVQVLVTQQGDAVCGNEGYMLKRSENVAAFYLDGRGKTGRIYALTSCATSWIDGKIVKIPSLCIENGEEDSEVTEICFPEYEGWDVHCTGGGKVMAVCLVKEYKNEA